MFSGMEMMACPNLAVPADVMAHVVHIESSRNPYAIGVVGGRLIRQPRGLAEAIATVRMLEEKGYNYSLGAAQVNRANLEKFGLSTLEKAFDLCLNVRAGSRILQDCYLSAGKNWSKAFSCYYSGNFTTGFQHGYVQRILASMGKGRRDDQRAVPLVPESGPVAAEPTISRELTGTEVQRGADVVSATPEQPVPAAPPAGTPASIESRRPFRPVVHGPNDVAASVSSRPQTSAVTASPTAATSLDALAEDRAPKGDGAFVF